LSAERPAAQPRAAVSVFSNRLVAPAPFVGCSGWLGASFLEFHVPPSIRICRVLPQKQAAIFFAKVVIRRTERRRRVQLELQCLVTHLAEPPSTTSIVRSVIGSLKNWHVHDGPDRARPVRPKHERVLLHRQVFTNADITQTLDGEIGGPPASHELGGSHWST